jgi:hypothetical protein
MKNILAGLSVRTVWRSLLCLSVALSHSPTTLASTPPENYKGPVAEPPVLQRGDYWVYQRGNATTVKSTARVTNIEFPLWIGKTWSYDGESLPIGRSDPTSKASRIPVRTECSVTAFKQVTVAAGTFGAFECQCSCAVIANKDRGCGESTIWYAPDVKNIVIRRTESTASSFELVEFRLADRISDERQKADNEKRKIGQADKAEIPAKLIRTIPEDESKNVPASLKEILIVFDQPMSSSWNLSCSPTFYPNASAGRRCSEGGVYWRDDRTFVVALTAGLKPNQRYSFNVNPNVGLEKYDLGRAFRGLGQPKPIAPQRFFFTTGPG